MRAKEQIENKIESLLEERKKIELAYFEIQKNKPVFSSDIQLEKTIGPNTKHFDKAYPLIEKKIKLDENIKILQEALKIIGDSDGLFYFSREDD